MTVRCTATIKWPERGRATPAERKAWRLLRNRGILGLKFRRQHVLRGFIVDFYCAELKLVLEIDGAVHKTEQRLAYDRERDAVLRGAGCSVVHFPNDHVSRAKLETLLLRFTKSPTRPPLPLRGRGDRGEGVTGHGEGVTGHA